MRNFAALVFVSLFSAFAAIFVYEYFFDDDQTVIEMSGDNPNARYTNFNNPVTTTSTYNSSAPTSFTEASSIATPAVVNISARTGGSSSIWGYGGGGEISSGSGVIISGDGYIVTNNHVVEGASELEVSLNDKRKFDGELIGVDPTTDLALIKIKERNLPYLKMGNSDGVQIGEWVLAVGNPFNLTSTVTAGIVSAKARNINILEEAYSIESFIQTDAAVNPGNSGGALVNTNGELIGVNTAIITRSGRYEGYSFAVPSNLVKKVVEDLKDFGKVQRGFLGVVIGDITDEIAKENGLSTLDGVLITQINGGSAAEAAGLKPGDVITKVNGQSVKSTPELQEQVALFRPGNKIKLEYIRNGRTKTADAILKDANNRSAISGDAKKKSSGLENILGFELRNLTENEERKLKTKGAMVISITRGGKIDRTNMDPGYVITRVNDKRVRTIEEVLEAIRSSDEIVVLEGVYENYPEEYFYTFRK